MKLAQGRQRPPLRDHVCGQGLKPGTESGGVVAATLWLLRPLASLPGQKKPDLRASPRRPQLPEKGQTPELSVLQRLALLEALAHAQAVQISNLSSENQAQRKRIDEYETDLAALRLEIGRVDRQVDGLDLEFSEQREDIIRLEGNVQYCLDRENEIVEAVIDTVTEQISERGLSAANIHFTLGEG